MTFEFGIAKHGDYAEVAGLCMRAVGKDDYVLPILRKIISAGGLFIALDGDRLIGITNYQKTLDGSGWMSSARTDPDYRGKGVAGMLQKSIAQHARKEGVKDLRLWINKSNTPSIKAALRGDFYPLVEIAHVSKNVSKGIRRIESLQVYKFENPSRSEIADILNSNYLRQMNGFFALNWQLVKSSDKVISSVARRGELYKSMRGDIFIIPKEHELWGDTQHNEFAPLMGPLNRSLNTIEIFSHMLGAGSIGTFLPFRSHYLATARVRKYRAEDWGDHAILFEKII